MFDRFTERARKTMSLARQEAQRFNHDYIGTEHILLGLLDEGSGVAAQVLRNLEIDSEKIRTEVAKLVTNGTNMITMGQLPFTRAAKRVLELSLEEAQNLGHSYIGTEHLLLGLLRENDGIAAQVLRGSEVQLEKIREEVLELLGREPREDGPSPGKGGLPPVARRPAPMSLRIALEQSALRRHLFVGTEHLLLDVVLQPGPAADLLAAAGATADAVTDAIDRLRANGGTTGPRTFSACAGRVVTIATHEARRRGNPAFGPAHLLLGLIAVPEGLAMTALTNLGVDIAVLLANVSKLLDAG